MGQKANFIARRGLIGLVLMVLLVPALVLGQATSAADCSAEAHAAILDHYAGLIREAGADVGAQLTAMQTDLAALDADCNGLAFEGSAAKVIGPIILPAGLYKATVTTDGFFIAHLQVTDGKCGPTGFGELFNLMAGDAKGADSLVQSSGCTAFIALSNISAPWTLSISKIG